MQEKAIKWVKKRWFCLRVDVAECYIKYEIHESKIERVSSKVAGRAEWNRWPNQSDRASNWLAVE